MTIWGGGSRKKKKSNHVYPAHFHPDEICSCEVKDFFFVVGGEGEKNQKRDLQKKFRSNQNQGKILDFTKYKVRKALKVESLLKC